MSIDKVTYWKELADYDIDAAEVMYRGGKCYPSYKDELAKKLTKEFCKELINRTKELKLWIESKH